MEAFNQIFLGTSLLAVLSYLGYQLRSVPTLVYEQLRKRIIYSAHIEGGSELFTYFEIWLSKYHTRYFKNVIASLSSDNIAPQTVESDKKEERLMLNHHTDIFILRYKGKRLVITKGREKFVNVSDIKNAFYNNFRIDGWFARDEINALLNEVIEYNKKLKKVRQLIYTNTNWGDWSEFGIVHGKSLENVIIRQKEEIVNNIKDFLLKEEWYYKRGLSYKRGYLFYGAPGNGKTSLCLALSSYFNKHIQFLNLNDLEKDSNLINAFRSIKNNSILVIEDVDVAFGKRDGKSRVSFSALLNCLDGAFSKNGVITIITTNYIEKLDAALIREGRIDMKIKIDNPEVDMVEEYLSIFYGKNVKLDNYKNSMSMSKIQEICLLNKDDFSKTVKTLCENVVVQEQEVACV